MMRAAGGVRRAHLLLAGGRDGNNSCRVCAVSLEKRSIQMEPAHKTRDESAQFFAEEARLWGNVIKQANIPMQ